MNPVQYIQYWITSQTFTMFFRFKIKLMFYNTAFGWDKTPSAPPFYNFLLHIVKYILHHILRYETILCRHIVRLYISIYTVYHTEHSTLHSLKHCIALNTAHCYVLSTEHCYVLSTEHCYVQSRVHCYAIWTAHGTRNYTEMCTEIRVALCTLTLFNCTSGTIIRSQCGMIIWG